MTCSSPVRIAAPLPRFASWVTTRTVLSPSWREHVARAVGAAVVDDDDLEVDGARPARIRRTISTTVLRSLKTGTMTESLR